MHLGKFVLFSVALLWVPEESVSSMCERVGGYEMHIECLGANASTCSRAGVGTCTSEVVKQFEGHLNAAVGKFFPLHILRQFAKGARRLEQFTSLYDSTYVRVRIRVRLKGIREDLKTC